MDHSSVLVMLLVFGGLSLGETKGQCPPVTYFYYIYDWALEDHVVNSTIRVPKEDYCYAYCIKDQRCRSFNFQIQITQQGHRCEINYSTKNRHPSSMKKRPGWVYYEIKDADFLPTLDRVTATVKLPFGPEVEEFSNINLHCDASGKPAPTITWSKIDGELPVNSQINGNILTLSRVLQLDDGTYLCRAENKINVVEATARINVVPILKVEKAPPEFIKVSQGSRVQLDCKATRRSIVTWERKDASLPVNYVMYPNGTLVLHNVSESHSGYYECTAKNKFSQITRITHVHVGEYYRTCSHIKAASPSKTSGFYKIKPSTIGADVEFEVFCNMSEKNGIGVTVVSHDSERREYVSGCDPPGCFKRSVTYYNTTINQLASLARVSSHCEQFVKFECKGGVEFIVEKVAWWVSRDGVPMYYWGGAAPGSSRCACGMSDSCISRRWCNCDNFEWGGAIWYVDEGFLTDKRMLPVTQLRFGDVGHEHEHGYYTLGKFKCYGVISNEEPIVITKISPSTTVVQEENVTLTCVATGRPSPTITWRRADGFEILGRWSLSGGNLTLVQVTYDNHGTYICEASNAMNTTRAEVNLTILIFTVMPPPLSTAADGIWVRLDCQSNIASNITWQRRDENSYKNYTAYPNGTLILENAVTNHSGDYECTASVQNKTIRAQTQVMIGNLSCFHIKAGYPDATSGNYKIDSNGGSASDSFTVYCDMDSKNAVGVTIVDYSLIVETGLTRVSSKCEQIHSLGKSKCYGSMPETVPVNIAQRKPTAQSTVDFFHQSGSPVDGNTETCTNSHFIVDDDPWWRVDLISCYVVTRVNISQENSPHHLTNFEIRIGASLANRGNNNPRVLEASQEQKIGNYSFAPPAIGRFVTIRKPGNGRVLYFCEVEVFGVYTVCPSN